ncbi:MAG: NAD(P)-binding protein [Micromonosporaceae bacterium]|nr:NAD(P)-binding protein [Micromonosporaceae bacterium]
MVGSAQSDRDTGESPFHVVIIGGGLAGLCLAQGLFRSGISVTVYEADASPEVRAQGYRISLKATGTEALWPHLFDLCLASSLRPATRSHLSTSPITNRSGAAARARPSHHRHS